MTIRIRDKYRGSFMIWSQKYLGEPTQMRYHHMKFDPIDSIIYHDIWDVKVHSSLLAFNNNDNTVLQQENLHRCFGPIKGSNQPAECTWL